MASPSMDVEGDVKCPICMEFLTDPVTLDCGHNFCRACITHFCKIWESLGDLECPLCKTKMKKESFRPNWQLANIVEKIKFLSLNLGKENTCVRHQEKLNLFCKEDQELVCVSCERSPEHQSHTLLLLEEAARECKGQLCSCLEVLRKEQERILENKAGTEKKSQDLLNQIEAEKTKTMALFNQLHQFLEEQKMLFLLQMEELEKEIVTRREEHMARLREELSSLEDVIQQMDKTCQKPATELLQDIGRTLKRSEKKKVFENLVVFPPELTCRIGEFSDRKPLLEGVMKQFPGKMVESLIKDKILKRREEQSLLRKKQYGFCNAKVTLDPDTAHPQLILSEDLKSIRWGGECQDLRDNPERFNNCPVVLGREGFTAGRHFWDVTVGSEGGWAVGVARKSVGRKGSFHCSPVKGIWALGKWGGPYTVLNSPDYAVSLNQEVRRLRVALNCVESNVTFSDADTGIHIFTYSGASFCGETLLPFFFVSGKAHLKLSP